MLPISPWRIFASLGVPGLAFGVFYFMFRDVAKEQNPWLVAMCMLLTAALVYVAMTRLPTTPPRSEKEPSNTKVEPEAETREKD